MTDAEINDAIAAAEQRVTAKLEAALAIAETRRAGGDLSNYNYAKLAHERITKVVNELKKVGPFPTI